MDLDIQANLSRIIGIGIMRLEHRLRSAFFVTEMISYLCSYLTSNWFLFLKPGEGEDGLVDNGEVDNSAEQCHRRLLQACQLLDRVPQRWHAVHLRLGVELIVVQRQPRNLGRRETGIKGSIPLHWRAERIARHHGVTLRTSVYGNDVHSFFVTDWRMVPHLNFLSVVDDRVSGQ